MSKMRASGTTAKQPGRNDPCLCGSGKKFKKCCLPKEEAVALDAHVKAEAEREARAEADRQRDRVIKAEMLASWAAGAAVSDGAPLDAASNAVVDLVKAGKLEEAEAAARSLLAEYPEVHDGWDRLGMVHEARGQNRKAADCYRQVLDVIRQHPDDYDPEFADVFVTLIAKLDPSPAS